MERAFNDPRKLEKLLGLDDGYLGDNPVLVEIPNPEGTRLPTGREFGANTYWKPGGHTDPGGLPEVVIEPVKSGDYIVKDAFS